MSMPSVDNPEKQIEITSVAQLVEDLASGIKPKEKWRIGTEHEKFLIDRQTQKPLAYETGIKPVLTALAAKTGWHPIFEEGNIIALQGDAATVSLEPGGQFELSGAPVASLSETEAELRAHFDALRPILTEIGAQSLCMGFAPTWTRADVDWMPKKRYQLMRDWMPQRGALGLDMMLRTSTVQVNLDFSSEQDMIRKFRVSLALQPLATALFATSPYREGAATGYCSLRSHIWTDTDGDRCGTLPFVFDDDFSFEKYVEYVLDVPMYFIHREGRYIDALGESFRSFLAGTHSKLSGYQATMQDWEDHLTTVFPEVRLKKYLEMRGADAGPFDHLLALPAFWVGLLYDEQVLTIAEQYVVEFSAEDRERLRDEAPKLGLQTRWRDGTLGDLAEALLPHIQAGLYRWHQFQGVDLQEDYLRPLEKIVQNRCSLADLVKKEGVNSVFAHFSI